MTEERVHKDVLAVMGDAPPHLAYAFAKTGLMLREGMEEYYKAAIDEYFRLEDKGGQH